MPRWAIPFAQPAPYKCAYGGRASGKTYTVAHLIVAEAVKRPIRVACVREFQSSISESAKPALEKAINRMGLKDTFFKITDRNIRGINGSYFFFKGCERNREEIRGWEDIDITWVEEAQRLSPMTAQILIPTVMRKDDSEFWVTWNPKNRTDWVWQRFILNPRPTDVIQKVDYMQNRWLPARSEEERAQWEIEQPHTYVHVWLGEPDDGVSEKTLLPYSVLSDCVEAHRRGLHKDMERLSVVHEIGLDVADAGKNLNAMVRRYGAIVRHAEDWRAEKPGDLYPTAKKVHDHAEKHKAEWVRFDKGSFGAMLSGEFQRLYERHGAHYGVKGISFGGAVDGPKRIFVRAHKSRTNEQAFARKNIQMAWGLKLRADRTVALLKGREVDPELCLFIDPAIPNLEHFMSQLAQPLFRESPSSGKLEIDKRAAKNPQTDTPEDSPDLFDAACLAFSRDTDSGLKAL